MLMWLMNLGFAGGEGAEPTVMAVFGRAYSLTAPIVARDLTPDVEGRSVTVPVKAHSARAVIP